MGNAVQDIKINQNPEIELVDNGSKLDLDDPVEKGFRWILLLGRLFGVSPISVPVKANTSNFTFRWWSFPAIHSLTLAFITMSTLVFELWAGIAKFGSYPTIYVEMNMLQPVVYIFSLLLIYIYFLQNSQHLVDILQLWSSTTQKLNLVGTDRLFPKFCLILMLFEFGPGVLEIFLYNKYLLQWASEMPDMRAPILETDNFIQKLYKINLGPMANYLPYFHWTTSILLIYGIGIGYFCWHFADLLTIVMCRALSHKFKQIEDEVQSYHESCKMKPQNGPIQEQTTIWNSASDSSVNGLTRLTKDAIEIGKIKNEPVWRQLRAKIFQLCDLAEKFTSFVGSLLLITYGGSIYVVILNILRILSEPNEDNSPFIYFSFFKFAIQLFLVTYYASQVYHSTEGIVKAMERFPNSAYSESAKRLEWFLKGHPVKVTIAGSVVISRKTFIAILSFVFTTEIVLMQAMSAASSGKA